MPPKGKKQKREPEKPPADEAFQVVELTTREPRTVVVLLNSPEPAVVCKACEALHKYMENSQQNCLELEGLNVISHLVKLLSATEKAVRAYSVLCLADMAGIASIRKHLFTSNCLPSLLSLLSPEEEEVTQQKASSVVAHMSTEYTSKAALLKMGAIQPLLQLIQDAIPDTQRNALTAISRLAEMYQARAAIAQDGGIPCLLSLLDSEFPPIQQLALHTLHSLTQDVDCRSIFRDSDGLTKIVTIIGNKEYSDLHTEAISLLSQCLHDAENMTSLQSSGTLQLLLEHISNSEDAAMKRAAMEALSKAARDDINRQILHEQKVEKTLIEQLSSDDPGLLKATLDGISCMSTLSSSRQTIGGGEGVEGIVRCGKSEVGSVKGAASHALAQISRESPANCKLIQECGGCPVLVYLLTNTKDNPADHTDMVLTRIDAAMTRANAALTITQLGLNQSARAEFLTTGALLALIGCLRSEVANEVIAAAEAVAMMATDEEGRIQFLSSGGVPLILPLLHSNDPQIVGAGLATLRSTGQSRTVAIEYCERGALEVLSQLSQSGHTPLLCGLALHQLLNFDLSAKWWLLGRLEPTDVLRDCEFFDAGKGLSSSQPFTPLSSLLSLPLHMNRPILTANLLPPPHATPPSDGAPPSSVGAPPTSVGATPPHPPPEPQTRTKSRGKSRKGRDVESKSSDSPMEEQAAPPILEGAKPAPTAALLPPDTQLWEHITHTLSHVTPLTSTIEQAEALASYVCSVLGGPLEQPGNMTFDLSLGETQKKSESNVVALGDVAMGTYRHRALLFKVIADQLGIPCSLVRGDYGRHWNEITVATDITAATDGIRGYVVDLVSSSKQRLLLSGSPQAHQYIHL